MDLQNIFKTIHLSIKEANEKFLEWTDGWSLQAYGVEGFIVASLANSIMDKKNSDRPGYLKLETPFEELYECSSIPIGKKGKSKKITNRIDISLYHKNWSLSHVIEVKRKFTKASYDDLDRLCSLYKINQKNNRSSVHSLYVQIVVIGITITEARIAEHFKELEEKCLNYVKQKHNLGIITSRGTDFYQPMLMDDDDDDGKKKWAFSSFCLSIKN